MENAANVRASGRRRLAETPPTLIISAGVALSVIIGLMGGVALYQMREDAIDNARQALENLALTLERAIARSLQTYELSMHAVIDGMKVPEVMSLPPNIRQLVLFDRSSSAEDLGSMLTTDDRGNIALDSHSTPPRPVNVADRDYFLAQKADPNVGVFISKPFQSRLASEALSIGISSRINRADGSFAGVVVGTMRLNFFQRLFDGVELGGEGTLTLVRADGVILMCRPFNAAVIGQDTSSSPAYQI